MEIKQKIEQANAESVKRFIDAELFLVDVAPAGEVIPGLTDKMIIHSGPPISWEKMCGAQKGAVIGNVIFEGWAKDYQEAEELLKSGVITLEPNHHHNAVGPMAGTISKNAPVWVVENRKFGNRSFCRQVEGKQQFGNYHEEAIEDLRKWRDLWAPALRKGLLKSGGLDLRPIIAQALQMGDELHNRHSASSSLFANKMAVMMVEADVQKSEMLPTLYYVTNHNLIFLGLAMACGKAITDPAYDIPYSTIVTAMARNGTEFGIRVSGLGNEWFTAPAPLVDGLYLPGYSEKDAGLDMGDSAITETVGWGAFTLAGATGILSLVGGTPEEAMAYTREMRNITETKHTIYRMPIMNFEGISVGIDVRKVVQSGIAPIIDTAIAHKNPGYSIIGAGLVRAPMECFKKALIAFGKKYQ